MEPSRLPSPATLADCIDAIARDPTTASLPAASEAKGSRRTVSYAQLSRLSNTVAANLAQCHSSKTVCIIMQRTIDWYAIYLACTRVGIPVVAASRDHPDKAQEIERLRDIVDRLYPSLIITDIPVDEALPGFIGKTCVMRSWELVVDHGYPDAHPEELGETMAYNYTGGTTCASKCVSITHRMAVEEVTTYPTITSVRPKRVLQNSSLFWPASALGQIDIAIAFKACLILSVGGGAISEDVNTLITENDVDCIGVVPSVLRSLSCEVRSLRLVFTWGEALPPKVAHTWSSRVTLIDLLIATEYWLSLYANISGDTWSYSVVPSLVTHLEPTAQEGTFTLWLSGPMVTPGYIGIAPDSTRFKTVDGVRYFCTNDTVRPQKVESGCPTFTYAGRSDDLVKIGGKFVDLRVVEQRISDQLGRVCVKELALIKDSQGQLHACFALRKLTNISTLVQAVQQFLPSVRSGQVHIIEAIPRNPATGKMDTRSLVAKVASPDLSPQYRIPDAEIKPGKLLGIPNPYRWVWLVVVILVVSIDVGKILHALISFIEAALGAVTAIPSVWKLAALPFTTQGLTVIASKYRKLKKLIFEFPGDTPFAAIALLVLADFKVIQALALTVTTAGLGIIALRRKKLDISVMSQCVWSYALLFYVSLPWDLAWAWKDWWKNVDSFWDLIPYYRKRLNQVFSRFPWYNCVKLYARRFGERFRGAFNQYDVVGYPDETPFKKKTYFQYPAEEQTFPCDSCHRKTNNSQGAFDRYKKFGTDREKWFCETCWWSEVVDEVSARKYKRIGQWSHGPRLSDTYPKQPSYDEVSTREGSEDSEGESNNFSLDEVEGEIKTGCQSRREIARICLEALQTVGYDKNLIMSAGLTSLSSLVKVSVHEQLKSRLPQVGSESAVALFSEVYSFSKLVDKVSALAGAEEVKGKTSTATDGSGDYMINNCGPALWTMGACDWLLKFRSETQIEDPEQMLTDSVRALMKRHPVFRARPVDDLRISDFLQQSISLSPGWLRGLVLIAAKNLWPRIRVKPFCPHNPLPLSFIRVSGKLGRTRILSLVDSHRGNRFVPPVEFVVFISANAEAVPTIYVYFRISHLFADGYAVNTIAADLEAMLGDLSKTRDLENIEIMNGLEVLQRRHLDALARRPTLNSVNMCSSIEELWREEMLVKVMWLHRRPVEALKACGAQLGLPTEIVVMGVVIASLAEKLGWTRTPLSLMHAMRDGVNEAQMIGYFSDYKDMGFMGTDCCYAELFHQLASRVRSREWRQYDQSLLYDHSIGRHAWDKSVFPISVNMLSHVRRPTDSKVENVGTYWRASNRNGLRDCRLIHVYLEETQLDAEWAIRLHFSRRLFDCSWVVEFVCRSFDKALRNVLTDPSQPIHRLAHKV